MAHFVLTQETFSSSSSSGSSPLSLSLFLSFSLSLFLSFYLSLVHLMSTLSLGFSLSLSLSLSLSGASGEVFLRIFIPSASVLIKQRNTHPPKCRPSGRHWGRGAAFGQSQAPGGEEIHLNHQGRWGSPCPSAQPTDSDEAKQMLDPTLNLGE